MKTGSTECTLPVRCEQRAGGCTKSRRARPCPGGPSGACAWGSGNVDSFYWLVRANKMYQRGRQGGLWLGSLWYPHLLCLHNGVRCWFSQFIGDSCHLTQGRESNMCLEDQGQNPNSLTVFINQLDKGIEGTQRGKNKGVVE